MAYTTPPVQATGDLISASDWNTLIRDNMMTLFPYTTAGDLAYAATSTTLARLAAGAAGTILNSSGSAPQYSSLASITASYPLVTSQAAGDLFYSTSDNATARFPVGTAGQFIQATTDGVPAYKPIVYRRQGGNATNWITSGTTTYTPTAPLIQVGAKDVSVNTTGSTSVTFPVAYSDNPIVVAVCYGDSGSNLLSLAGITATGFDVNIRDITTSGAITVKVMWQAIGE